MSKKKKIKRRPRKVVRWLSYDNRTYGSVAFWKEKPKCSKGKYFAVLGSLFEICGTWRINLLLGYRLRKGEKVKITLERQ